MESDLPWFYLAVRRKLAADAGFMAACGGRLSEGLPASVTQPLATVQFPGSIGAMGGGGYKPLVQIDAWCPPGVFSGLEASAVVWRIVSRAKRVLEYTHNEPFETMHWSARPVDLMPLPLDVSRGESNPLFRAMTRAVLTVKNT
ncbi:MAG TPA: hypothetical protein VEB22_09745 [Phycisphaerales bacterium]|nr:hypothetical protein [Phycisphaerales bacterium]